MYLVRGSPGKRDPVHAVLYGRGPRPEPSTKADRVERLGGWTEARRTARVGTGPCSGPMDRLADVCDGVDRCKWPFDERAPV